VKSAYISWARSLRSEVCRQSSRVVLYSVCFLCMHISYCKHIQAFRRVWRPCPYSAARLILVHVVNVCVTPYPRTGPLSRFPYVVMQRDRTLSFRDSSGYYVGCCSSMQGCITSVGEGTRVILVARQYGASGSAFPL
jgi:hypothetical protein